MVQLHKKFTDGQVRAELEPQVKAWLKRVHPNDIKG